MNKKFLTFVSCCVIGTVLQAGGYLYLDQYSLRLCLPRITGYLM